MIVRYDPRDLSRIYLLAPDGQYYDVNYRSLGRHRSVCGSIAWRSSVYVTKARGTSTRLRSFAPLRRCGKSRMTPFPRPRTARRQRERRLRVIQGGRSDAAPVNSADASLIEDEEVELTTALPEASAHTVARSSSSSSIRDASAELTGAANPICRLG